MRAAFRTSEKDLHASLEVLEYVEMSALKAWLHKIFFLHYVSSVSSQFLFKLSIHSILGLFPEPEMSLSVLNDEHFTKDRSFPPKTFACGVLFKKHFAYKFGFTKRNSEASTYYWQTLFLAGLRQRPLLKIRHSQSLESILKPNIN